jgi:Gpi18-like mannosyltransferase
VALLILAALVRFALFDFVSGNMNKWIIHWYDHLNEHGYVALGQPLPNDQGYEQIGGNYTPVYYYLLYVATWFDRWIPKLYLIKLVNVAFDVVAAIFMYRILAATTQAVSPWVGFFTVLFAPTVLLNGSLWGQCDVIPHSLLLGCVYFTLVNRPLPAILCIGAAVSVKATAVFIFPYLLLLVLCRRLRWEWLLGVPFVYAVLMIPAALLGRPVVELATVYLTQGRYFDRLSMDAPNLYYFMSNDYYAPIVVAGILVTVAACIAYAVRSQRGADVLSPHFLLFAATLSVAAVPFLLPKMHDRYFFAADLVSIALALTNRRFWFVAAGFQVSSTLAYLPVLSEAWTWHWADRLAEQLFPIAIAINSILVAYLIVAYVRETREPSRVILAAP